MIEFEALPDGKKLPWSHSQEDLVTAVLALGGHLPNEDDLDALGERLLNMVDLDPSPFPDFRSMRLALQHGCDVATYEEVLNDELRQYAGALMALQEAGIGFGEQDGTTPEDDDISLEQLQDLINLKSKLALQATGGPAMRFVTMPHVGGKLCWDASLNDFVALAVFSDDFNIVPTETEGDRQEQIAERYRSIIDVDFNGCSNFQALRLAYPETVDHRIINQKAWRITKAHKQLLKAGPLTAHKRFPAFMVQSEYHKAVAEEVNQHWPQSDPTTLMFVFDCLFLPDELIDEVLESGI